MDAQYIEAMDPNLVAHRMASWRDLWAHTRFPGRCAVCDAWTAERVCADCVARFQGDPARCPRCGIGMPVVGQLCGACLSHPPPVDGTVVAVDYAFPWDRLVRALKFDGQLALAPLLAQRLMARAPPVIATSTSMVVPVPLHGSRLRERGFNQSWEIARHLGRQLGVVTCPDALLRWRATHSQAMLPSDERRANVQGAFMPDPRRGRFVRNQQVALVDDVMTTGATAHAAAQALREAGASTVTLWVVARTPAPATAE